MNKLSKNRDSTFDVSKGIGIILVILGHMPSLMPKWVQVYISSFHMPLFFFISGYFAKEIKDRKEYKMRIKRISASLLHMYIEYSVLFMLLEYVTLGFDINFLAKSLKSMLLGRGGYYVLWFLFSLYIVEIVFYTLSFCAAKHMSLLTMLIVIFGFACSRIQFNWFGIGSSFYAFGFFYLGFVFKVRGLFEKALQERVLVPLVLMHYLLVVFLYKRFGYVLGMVDNQSVDILCNYFVAVSGIILVVFVARGIKKSRMLYLLLSYVGRNSVYFYPLTAFIPDYCKLLLGSSAMVKIVSRVISFPTAIVYMKTRERILSWLKRN